ncbi:MAG: 4-hydroxy-3-methylbut-2-enyl diphosphate reductase [bacterium]|nr:4-hydroxy-3-methylbut-2-enyl diphosphate reductase [bacterium]MCM1376020.1 4-hydroxy-3-methylbut-2-enyl diphosphate reductase [Muribaculum sp.]
MEIRLAASAGFCFGVKRAVDTVYEQLQTGKTIYTYGPIVHNEEMVRELAGRGVQVIEDRRQLEQLLCPDNGRAERGTVIIRAHGVSREVQRLMEDSQWEIIDATCPFVKRIHHIVEENSSRGDHILVIGSPEHPEVEATVGWCNGPVDVLESVEDAAKYIPPKGKKLTLVAQTTFNYNKFQHIVEIFQKRGYNVNIVNTICNATEERQRAAREIAADADVMIVIGGKHSSNTRKLYEICKEMCDNTYFIQTLDDLHLELPKSARLVGITAGASTPNKLIEEVQNYVRINF